MVSTSTTTPSDYLASLPQDRREVISAVRDLILQYLPEGYEETINWGMLGYEVPLEVYPDTYNKKPLSYIALAAQKNYNLLYLMSVYQDPADYQELMDAFAAIGVKPDIGKSCVRFKKLEQLPLETIARLISKTSVQEFIETTKVLQNRKS